jgi:hypothetical protein
MTQETRDALLKAQLRYELDRFRGDAFDRMIDEVVSATFDWLDSVTVNDVVTPEQIVGVIDRYTTLFRTGGGIMELAGELAQRVVTSPLSEKTQVRAIISDGWLDDLVDELVALDGPRRELIHRVVGSSAYATMVAHALRQALVGFLFPEEPGVGISRLTSLLKGAIPDIEARLASSVTHFLGKRAEALSMSSEASLLGLLDEPWIRRTVDEIWASLAPMRLSELFGLLGAQHIEDFVVLVHEFWLQFRKTEFFSGIVRELVVHIFDKYGDESVRSLIEDMGVSREMVAGELRLFGRRVVEKALTSGFLEALLRAHIAPFYDSEDLRRLLRA